jgi:hypothetical protein
MGFSGSIIVCNVPAKNNVEIIGINRRREKGDQKDRELD